MRVTTSGVDDAWAKVCETRSQKKSRKERKLVKLVLSFFFPPKGDPTDLAMEPLERSVVVFKLAAFWGGIES